ncbi:uncharacterized protein LOC116212768 isoform X1 [Punica granatum]|uniref:Uncharacterized protein LOC116212768 isoform X1 n=1 Tax=Punica granatum TaxID=22663 RepID=A0A6P8E9V1_PUNGR|nr:uncharacterized protein LOC116212768 isoform X1 [Punica granatum]
MNIQAVSIAVAAPSSSSSLSECCEAVRSSCSRCRTRRVRIWISTSLANGNRVHWFSFCCSVELLDHVEFGCSIIICFSLLQFRHKQTDHLEGSCLCADQHRPHRSRWYLHQPVHHFCSLWFHPSSG